MSRGNEILFTTGSKADVTGDERPQLRTRIACDPTLPFGVVFRERGSVGVYHSFFCVIASKE